MRNVFRALSTTSKGLGRLFAVFAVILAADRLSGYAEPNLRHLVYLAANVTTWAALALVPALVLGRRARLVYFPAFTLMTIATTVQWFTRINHSMNLDGDIVGILLASSCREIHAFLVHALSGPRNLILMAVALAFLGFGLGIIFRFRPCHPARHRYLAATGLALVFILANPLVLHDPATLLRWSPSFNLAIDTWAEKDHYRALQALAERPLLPPELRLTATNAPFAVFVIGESAARSRLSLYGCERPTTPRLDALRPELCVFTDVTAAAYNTAAAMELMFTEATAEHPEALRCTFAQLLAKAGYRAVLFSAHERWGTVDGVESFVFSGCEEQRYLSEENLARPWYDDALLPFLDRELAAAGRRPTVVFLHLKGSHLPMNANYPQDRFRPFDGEETAASRRCANFRSAPHHYDNTIAFTDRLLGDIIERLRRLDVPTMMFYLSDHGESVASDRWRDVRDPNLWEIPMVAWFSPGFRSAFPHTVAETEAATDRRLKADGLLPGFVSLMQIRGYAAGANGHTPEAIATEKDN